MIEHEKLDIELYTLWLYEHSRAGNGKGDEQFLETFIRNVQTLIVKEGKPSSVTEERAQKDPEFRKYYDNKVKYALHFISFSDEIDKPVFYHFDKLFNYEQNIVIERKTDSFDYWFIVKLRHYDSYLLGVDSYLSHQFEHNFKNNFKEFSRFLIVNLRQFRHVLSPDVVLTAKEWLLNEESLRTNEVKQLKKEPIHISVKDEKMKGPINSFQLKKIESKNELTGEMILNFSDVFMRLKKNDFIDEDADLITFKSIFQNRIINKDDRINWVGSYKELQWFVHYFQNTKKISVLKKDIWFVTIRCFVKNSMEIETGQLKDARGGIKKRKDLLESILSEL